MHAARCAHIFSSQLLQSALEGRCNQTGDHRDTQEDARTAQALLEGRDHQGGARADGVFAKRLGILDNVSTLN
jgi:hypothetical protein